MHCINLFHMKVLTVHFVLSFQNVKSMKRRDGALKLTSSLVSICVSTCSCNTSRKWESHETVEPRPWIYLWCKCLWSKPTCVWPLYPTLSKQLSGAKTFSQPLISPLNLIALIFLSDSSLKITPANVAHPCLFIPSLLIPTNTYLASTQIYQKSPNAQKYTFERSENGNKTKGANDKSKHQRYHHLK